MKAAHGQEQRVKFGTARISGTDALECHYAKIATPATACGNSWFVYPGLHPPPTAVVNGVFTHTCTYDGSGNATGVDTFSGYAVRNTYYCMVTNGDWPFQVIVPQ